MRVRRGWTLGRLFDLGPYPAMIPGGDRVLGEIWQFRDADLPETLRILDAIEGTNQPGEPNLYYRCITQAIAFPDADADPAYTYVWAAPDSLPTAGYLRPTIDLGGALYSCWPPPGRD